MTGWLDRVTWAVGSRAFPSLILIMALLATVCRWAVYVCVYVVPMAYPITEISKQVGLCHRYLEESCGKIKHGGCVPMCVYLTVYICVCVAKFSPYIQQTCFLREWGGVVGGGWVEVRQDIQMVLLYTCVIQLDKQGYSFLLCLSHLTRFCQMLTQYAERRS